MDIKVRFAQILSCFFMIITMLCLAGSGITQTLWSSAPFGCSSSGTFAPPLTNSQVTWSRNSLKIFNRTRDVTIKWDLKGIDIVDVAIKKSSFDPNIVRVMILLSDGSLYRSDFDGGISGTDEWTTIFTYGNKLPDPQQGIQITGDALYMVTQPTGLFVQRDSGQAWAADTNGLGSALTYCVQIDSSQYVYLATSNGIYKQTPAGTTWAHLDGFGTNAATWIFIDRRDRIFAATYGGVYLSLDHGTTWTPDTSGMGKKTVISFNDDAFGNAYAVTPSAIYKSSGGTALWSRIDQGISNRSFDPSNHFIFNSISGDTAIYAATSFGVFASNDQGSTWSESNAGLHAENIYGLVKTKTGRIVVTTDLGVFEQKTFPDTNWTKQFPPNGYIQGRPLLIDNAGSMYTLGNPHDLLNPNASPKDPWKSLDNGATWQVDTATISVLAPGQANLFYVDETGTEHAALFGNATNRMQIYAKSPGGSWAADEQNFTSVAGGQPQLFASGHNGSIYFATSGQNRALWRRAISGGAWETDTIGLGLSSSAIYSIAGDRKGGIYAGSYGTYGVTILHQTSGGSSWNALPYPPSLDANSANAVFFLSVDSTGALLAAFSNYNYPTNLGRGIYSTIDDGAHWKYRGLDSVAAISGLVSYGDTTYAMTYGRGMYILTSGTTGAVDQPVRTSNSLLENIYPNPTTGIITVQNAAANLQHVTVTNILGESIIELAHPNAPDFTLDLSKLPPGTYFAKFSLANEVITRKILKE